MKVKISRWFNRDQLHCLLIGSDGGREQWSVLIWFQCECPAGLYSCVYSLHSSRSRCCCSRLPASTAHTKVSDPPVVPLFCAMTPYPKIQSKSVLVFSALHSTPVVQGEWGMEAGGGGGVHIRPSAFFLLTPPRAWPLLKRQKMGH